MTITKIIDKSDWLGIFASGLCLLHCLAAPFLFVAHSHIEIDTKAYPSWWGSVDIAFLILSSLAVYWSARNTPKKWIANTFWALWALLALIILNEKWELWYLAEEAIYLPTLGLAFLHFHNHRHCRCEDANCCVDH